MARGRKPKTKVEITDYSGITRLPQVKVKNGYQYDLISRTNKAAMYKMVNVKEPSDVSIHYEVFRILITQPCTLINKSNGKAYEYGAAEKFPGNNDFGVSAWCFNSEEAATQKYEAIK